MYYTESLLGGGVNNMLMHLAQLLSRSCASNAGGGGDGGGGGGGTLVLPRLLADPIDGASGVDKHTPQPSLAFGDVFDVPRLQTALHPCDVTDTLPPRQLKAEGVRLALEKLENGWEYGTMLARVYAAVQPSLRVHALVDALSAAATRHAGSTWLAAHLPIEHDWWHDSAMCTPRGREAFTKRCYSPADVAAITRALRELRRPSGVLLLFAADKVSKHGPHICPSHFGNATYRLQLPGTVAYTLRNAAELFFAASAPMGFVGNTFSTFSKAVALLRTQRAARRDTSWAYDCAPIEHHLWTPPNGRSLITLAHPGFEHMRVLEPQRCGY